MPPTRLTDYPAERLMEALARMEDPELAGLVWDLLDDVLGAAGAGAPPEPAPAPRRTRPRWLRVVSRHEA